nr:hypothetical protein [Tanacetum cinerariifolium]
MSSKAAGRKGDIESKQAISVEAADSKHDMSTAGTNTERISMHQRNWKSKGSRRFTNHYLRSPDEERTSQDAVESPYMWTIRSKGFTRWKIYPAQSMEEAVGS